MKRRAKGRDHSISRAKARLLVCRVLGNACPEEGLCISGDMVGWTKIWHFLSLSRALGHGETAECRTLVAHVPVSTYRA
jgi:hypothetical protein